MTSLIIAQKKTQRVSFTVLCMFMILISMAFSPSVSAATSSKSVTITANYLGVKPIAAFTTNITSGTAPLTVLFTDQSSGTAPMTCGWDFTNDGIIESTSSPVTYTYNNPGEYKVNLTATNLAGSNSATATITVTASIPIPLTPGETGATYSADIPSTGWSGSSDFGLAPGSELPPGLSLDPKTGIISGIIGIPPKTPFTYSFTITASDSSGHPVSQTYTITVTAALPKPLTGGTDDLDNTNNGGTGTGQSFGISGVALSQDLLAPAQENVVASGTMGFSGISVTTSPTGERTLDIAPGHPALK